MGTHNSIRARTRKPTSEIRTVNTAHEIDTRPPSDRISGPPSQEAIAARAYALFLARGAAHGDDWADWLRAEAELRSEGTPATGRSSHSTARGDDTSGTGNEDRRVRHA
jgi:hypothetical protein